MTTEPVVLLIEDEPDDVLLVQRAFDKAAVRCTLDIVQDGDRAVTYLSTSGNQSAPALVLLDLKLPRRSGLDVLRWIRQQPGLRLMPVVVLTSSMESRDVHEAYARGANSYLLKPVRFEDLLEMIRTVKLYWLLMNRRPEGE